MGIQSALNSGVSGLSAYSHAMSVIGNNIANSNTTGFKASRPLFSDLLPSSVAASGGTAKVGKGVNLASVDNLFTQGSIESTSSNTDLAIEGSGFFIVQDPLKNETLYTRAGAFHLNEQGRLVDPNGYQVQGYQLNDNGETVGALQDVNINTDTYLPGNSTSQVNLTTNLDSQSNVPATTPFDISNASETSNFASSVEVFDSLGEKHLLTTYFNKTGNNAWEYHFAVPGADVGTPGSDLVEVGSGSLSFDSDGNLTNPSPPTVSTNQISWSNGASAQTIDYNLNITQYASDSEVISQDQDGYGTRNLVDIRIDQDGNVIGDFSNGAPQQMFRLGLAKISNPQGLEKLGKNMFRSVPDESGSPAVGTVGSGVGKIIPNALEKSNVDIAEQFTNMITTQRAFQANSRTITTTDEMLNEVINLKR